MSDTTEVTEVVEVTRTVEVTQEAAAPDEAIIDWNAVPAAEQTVVEETVEATTVTTGQTTTTYRAPRGKWDFTDPQRIVIGVLLWLNILVFVLGYMAVTGRLGV